MPTDAACSPRERVCLLLAAIWLAAWLSLPNCRASRITSLLVAAGLSGLALVLPTWQGPRDPPTFDPQLLPIAGWLDTTFGTLSAYVPSLGVWAGVAGLLAARNVGPYPFYVLFASLASLTMYPRSDLLHAIVSSPPALVVGAGALGLVNGRLSSLPDWRRFGAMAAALTLVVAAAAPQVAWRVGWFVSPDDTGRRLDYQPLGLSRAPVLVPRPLAEDMRNVVSYVQAGTPPGQPLFAYPVDPLFNFLADRPSPTPFDHFLPGTLTPADLDQVIRDLQQARPRYVIWDHAAVLAWRTDPDNRPLSDYLWQCYREVAVFRLHLVLERTQPTC
jgi:hypothetical protein